MFDNRCYIINIRLVYVVKFGNRDRPGVESQDDSDPQTERVVGLQ